LVVTVRSAFLPLRLTSYISSSLRDTIASTGR
jgi:hypothetical protein